MKYFTDPVKSSLLAHMNLMGEFTTKALLAANLNITQATLYRYIKKMLDDGLIAVSRERQVRNVIEKTYKVTSKQDDMFKEMLETNDGAAYHMLFQHFAAGIAMEFGEYASRDDIDIINDGSGFRSQPFYANLEDLKKIGAEIEAIIKPYYEQGPGEGRQLRNFARIITPPKK